MRKAYYFHGNIIKFLFKKHYCPWCDDLLSKKMNHKIINSNSEETKKYERLYSSTDGGSIIGNFDSDIRHHVFYCDTCNREIEHKTLFSYKKTKKQITKLIKIAKINSIEMEVKYLDKDNKEIKKEDKEFFDKVLISLIINGKNIEKVCYIACKYLYYEQARYFKSTEHLKFVKSVLRGESDKTTLD